VRSLLARFGIARSSLQIQRRRKIPSWKEIIRNEESRNAGEKLVHGFMDSLLNPFIIREIREIRGFNLGSRIEPEGTKGTGICR
jgi:hypothetical protein